MKYLLLWSTEKGNFWYETANVKDLQDPLQQIVNNHEKKIEGTSKPRLIKGVPQKITSIRKEIDGVDTHIKFQIEDI